jgi:hypothetical protein
VDTCLPRRKPLRVCRRRAPPIGYLHDRRERCEAAELGDEAPIVAKLPKIEGEPHGRMVESLDPFRCRDRAREETPPGSRSGVHRLERQRDTASEGLWCHDVEGIGEQPMGVAPGVATAAATVHHEHVGLELGRGVDRLQGIIDALAKRSPLTASESTGPLQARHSHARLLHERSGPSDADVRHLRAPQRDRLESMPHEVLELVGKLPSKRGQFTDRRMHHDANALLFGAPATACSMRPA